MTTSAHGHSFARALPKNPESTPGVTLDTAHSPLKVLAHPEMLRAFVSGGKVSPIHMRIGLTGACNMRCNFCNFHSPHEAQFYDRFSYTDFIPTDRCTGLLREFKDQGGRAVTFCGSGECTVHPGYVAISTDAHAAGLKLGLITNGSMLHVPHIARCVAQTHSWVRIGMNAGTSATFAAVTHHQSETLERLLHAVGTLREEAACHEFRVGLNFVITADNYQEVDMAAERARDSGAHYIRFEPEFYTALGHATIAGRMDDIKASLARVAALTTETFEVSIPKLDRGPMDRTTAVEGDFSRCHYSRFVTAVGADGNLYPCPQVHLNERYRIGNVVQDGYVKVLECGPREEWERSNPLRTDLCKTCFYRPQNELLEWLQQGRISLDDALAGYEQTVPETLHADFV